MPNKTNDLSKFFQKNIDNVLLENYKFVDTLRKNSFVVLSFRLNKDYQIIDLDVNSPYSELNYKIIKAFETYDFRQINISEASPLNTYALQILSREGNKMVVNCSSNLVYDRMPVFEGCELSVSFAENQSCIKEVLESHFEKNLTTAFLKNRKIFGEFTATPEFMVTENGTIEKVKWKTASDSLTIETNRIMTLFNKIKTPPMRNGNPTKLYIKEVLDLEIDSENDVYVQSSAKIRNKTLNPNTELALHFKKFISEAALEKLNKTSSKNKAEIRFSLDKNSKMINLTAKSFDEKTNNQLVEIFKKFPFEKLNIKQPNVLDTYYFTIFTVNYNGKVTIRCNENPFIYSEAIFDAKCGKSNSPEDLKTCNQDKISNLITSHFDKSLISQNDKDFKTNLNCFIEVDVDGTITQKNGTNTSQKFSNEFYRIFAIFPRALKPAYWKGKPVKSTYATKVLL